MSPAQQIVQACHAAHESGQRSDFDNTLSMVLCQADTEDQLIQESEYLDACGIEHILFRESDMNNQATAIATLPLGAKHRKLLSHWKLWR